MPQLMGGECVVTCVFLLVLVSDAMPTQHTWNATCPAPCECAVCKSALYGGWLKTVDCSNEKLSLCPRDLPRDTQALLLRGNAVDVTQVPSLPDLLQLDLSYNMITSLADLPLKRLSALLHLNLEGNTIETLPSDSLSALGDLQTLSLAKNNIKILSEDSLSGLSHLRELSLSDNKLHVLNATWWQHTEHLETLQLSNNEISVIEDHTFTSLPRLTHLSLANNGLTSLQRYSFSRLNKLQHLILDGNGLVTIPAVAFSGLANLHLLSLSSNPIAKIGYRDFYKLPVNEVHLCNMPVLRIVDPGAFYDLHNLLVLQMHDNPNLAYLARGAFVQTPNLHELYLHNNKLTTLSADLQNALPHVHLVSFHGNPIHCDCNIVWITRLVRNTSTTAEPKFDELGRTTCDTPKRWHGVKLHDLPSSSIASVCPPTVIPFFNNRYNLGLGTTATFECRAVGTNNLRISWILANGKPLNNTSNNSRIKFDPIGKLTINFVKAMDSGTYTCVATSDAGFDTKSSVLRVHSKKARVLLLGVATDFVTVTWNGTSDTIFCGEYTILHRRKWSDSPYKQIHIHAHARSFTVSHLHPETTYEFCIAYGSNHTRLNCIDVRTMGEKFNKQGITRFDPTKVLIVFMFICVSFVAMCVLVAMVKRHRRREAYKDPTTVVGNYNLGHMSNISLDDLYNPPSTPISTSKTSLVNKKKT